MRYNPLLTFEYAKTFHRDPHSPFGYTILPTDIETKELWLRHFRIYGQQQMEKMLIKRLREGAFYAVPCKNPEDFEKWLKQTNQLKPDHPKGKPRPLPPRQGPAVVDREELKAEIEAACRDLYLSRKISVPRAVELHVEVPHEIVVHWAMTIAEEYYHRVKEFPEAYARVMVKYPGTLEEAVETVMRNKGEWHGSLPWNTAEDRRDEIYQTMKKIAQSLGSKALPVEDTPSLAAE